MFNFFEDLNIKGHLQICKLDDAGNEEVIFDDKNIIVSGMGVGLAHLFAASGSNRITDYQIDRYQIGVAGSLARQVSSTFELASPLSSMNEYTTNNSGEVIVVSANQIRNGTLNSTSYYFGKIPFSKITRIDDNSVRYTIVIDKQSCNNLRTATTYLNEIGLFMKNPRGGSPDGSILVAYRYFSDIRKTTDFALVFRWTLSF